MYTTPLLILGATLLGFAVDIVRAWPQIARDFRADSGGKKAFTVAKFLMLFMLLLSVAVQFNDPDWLLWMFLYGFAARETVLALRKQYTIWVPIGLACYVIYAIYWMPNEMVEHPSNLLLDLRMHEKGVEEVREDGGLFLTAAWMLAMTVAWARSPGPQTETK